MGPLPCECLALHDIVTSLSGGEDEGSSMNTIKKGFKKQLQQEPAMVCRSLLFGTLEVTCYLRRKTPSIV